jgi:transposase
MNKIFVGMDVSKDDFKAAIKDEGNELIAPVKTFGHDEKSLKAFDKFIADINREFRSMAMFGMEATGIYHLAVYDHLVNAGKTVKVFNGIELKRFKSRIRKTKTDDIDAQIIAEALLLSREPSYHPTSEPDLIRLRELARLRFRLQKKTSQCKIQATRDLDVLCRGYTRLWHDVFSPSSICVMKATIRQTRLFEIEEEELFSILRGYMNKDLAEDKAVKILDVFGSAVIPDAMKEACILDLHMLIQQYEVLNRQLERVDRKIVAMVERMSPHMLTLPGIGSVTAGIILGEMGDLNRFTNLDQITAYAGLDPAVKQSGQSYRTGRISKRGSPMLRVALYKAALSSIRYNPVCKVFYDRLKAKGKHHKVCMTAVARKLLHIAYAVEKNKKDFYVPEYIQKQQEQQLSQPETTVREQV